MAYLPEESVRQLFIAYCVNNEICPAGRISVEREVNVHGLKRRYDLVLFDKQANPWILVECKAPSIELKQSTLDQIAQYNIALQVPYLIVTNGWSTLGCFVDLAAKTFTYLDELPSSAH